MNKKSIIALAAAAAVTVGLGAGSYAWFTSTATSSGNIFKAGTLAVTGTYDDWTAGSTTQLDMNNMQCGDIKTYNFSVSNLKDGSPSTLDLVYKNTITLDNLTAQYSLLKVAKFDVKINGSTVGTEKMDYTALKAILSEERTLSGGALHTDSYEINITLPEVLTADNSDDNYQGQDGDFTITTSARQNIQGASY